MEKRDNIYFIINVVAIVAWIKAVVWIPQDYLLFYNLLLVIFLVSLLYLIYLKRRLYEWPWEAIFYLCFLTIVGIISFANSIMGINPFRFFR
ncbi:MAG: hypothetical protein A3F82_04865 [Deltaproteobacteria bacterium RIFCSPLOWO2_12_FULL_44_12]|nr:MAG: hypothetical protein A2712_05915 [Deltaproteobacteria bacterium RIFCSPHIGHO2_01_FULL_43_49]OGQ16667.1 MAG: hypothetical protein A3D22_07040 [Deltaproteobacteria bacterium RIFCSPHIGHO2_02_FULL_44_53]OGQ29805.1 MAG: hypothetical protein A3D98_09705 [Deltaproteobacteria bacterium RIFCSPHIGHO2_12_FULL_44_21]OGQ33095.1 MAG: hypothetical protein A2979_03685 [Deltaproteobacteria bacterium RIFCSPLOWO2_01_FULL_45_74]OGQ42190.1 MAG: hypothetical protein A3I70_05990 [Deltaproteobacteria bacterium 